MSIIVISLMCIIFFIGLVIMGFLIIYNTSFEEELKKINKEYEEFL